MTAPSIHDKEAARLWREFLRADSPHGLAAFERLYAGFAPAVVRYCRSRLRDAHLAEDVAHTVFVRLLETRPPLKSSFTGLVLRTARNLCVTAMAQQTSPRTAPLDPRKDPESEPGDRLEEQERHTALADCLQRLSEPEQTLVVLHDGEGLTYRQIAEVLGLRTALSTFTRRLRRIRDALLRCLKEKRIF